jgi:hypothetical protein
VRLRAGHFQHHQIARNEKKKEEENSDGGRRQGRKTEDKPSSVKGKTGQKKNGKGRGGLRRNRLKARSGQQPSNSNAVMCDVLSTIRPAGLRLGSPNN